MNVLESQNGLLGMEFDRYLREHPKFADHIPDNAQVILHIEGNEEFNWWSTGIGKEQAEPNQPLLYVRIKKLAPAHSRIKNLELVIG